jgi:hypothetical protein
MRRVPCILAGFLAAATLTAAAAQPARAADPKLLGTFKDWAAYSLQAPKGLVCFIHSEPKREQGKYTRRGDVYVQVTHRPKEGARDVVSFTTGYTYKAGSDVEVEIGDAKYEMFTDSDTAWARDTKTDSQLVLAMIRGLQMVVRGTSNRGTLTTDTYSLNGFTAAYKSASSACGVKPIR